ncbi:MAG: thiamine pyrophosphate-binding protein, partial [Rhodospirillales bacterium]|nr:thiamine pyrophosphate-binding protein [Rhodospirillales bacterium]
MTETVVDHLVARFRELGVVRMFGVPGGGSSLDLIESAGRAGIEFVLCRTETAAAFMAAVSAELTGVPGVVLTGIGPGAASVVNGIAYASLERVPLILITDAGEMEATLSPHQFFDQQAVFAPITKGTLRLNSKNAGSILDTLIQSTCIDPCGPVHLDLTVKSARARILQGSDSDDLMLTEEPLDFEKSLSDITQFISDSHRPVLIVGLQARRSGVCEKLYKLVEHIGCPVLTSYKAKGAMPEDNPYFVGLFTGANAEAATLSKADFILTLGLDPIELIPVPWGYAAPVGVVMQGPSDAFPFAPAVHLEGDLAVNIEHLTGLEFESDWRLDEIENLRELMRDTTSVRGVGHTADSIVDALWNAAPSGTRLAVDAGAHMFSAMARWPAARPHDVLKSNGLSTMGFALPAAIASYLTDPGRPVIALTGDGGMLMCLAELSTAARLKIPVVVVVLNDAALSLIDIKQQRLQHPVNGVRYPPVDFAQAAKGLGCQTWSIDANQSIEDILPAVFSADGPTV